MAGLKTSPKTYSISRGGFLQTSWRHPSTTRLSSPHRALNASHFPKARRAGADKQRNTFVTLSSQLSPPFTALMWAERARIGRRQRRSGNEVCRSRGWWRIAGLIVSAKTFQVMIDLPYRSSISAPMHSVTPLEGIPNYMSCLHAARSRDCAPSMDWVEWWFFFKAFIL